MKNIPCTTSITIQKKRNQKIRFNSIGNYTTLGLVRLTARLHLPADFNNSPWNEISNHRFSLGIRLINSKTFISHKISQFVGNKISPNKPTLWITTTSHGNDNGPVTMVPRRWFPPHDRPSHLTGATGARSRDNTRPDGAGIPCANSICPNIHPPNSTISYASTYWPASLVQYLTES